MIPFDPASLHGICAPPLRLTAIVAMTPARVIGRDGSMPWHLPGDLAFFKRTTVNHPVVMGRKTYESIGKPLPRRRNIVLTRDPAWSAPGVETIHAPGDLVTLPDLTGRVFIIGGAEIYRIFLPLIGEIFITHVHANPPGDTVFPAFEDQFVPDEILEATPEFTIRSWVRRAGQ